MATRAFISSPLVFLLLLLVSFTACTDATVFFVKNQSPFTVWAAATPVAYIHEVCGGAELTPGSTWELEFVENATDGRIWACTCCAFDPSTGRGGYETGDCDGALLCVVARKPPMTLAEFTIGYGGAPDRYGISVVYGFNVPMDLSCSDADVIRYHKCPDGIHGYGDGKYHKCQGNETTTSFATTSSSAHDVMETLRACLLGHSLSLLAI